MAAALRDIPGAEDRRGVGGLPCGLAALLANVLVEGHWWGGRRAETKAKYSIARCSLRTKRGARIEPHARPLPAESTSRRSRRRPRARRGSACLDRRSGQRRVGDGRLRARRRGRRGLHAPGGGHDRRRHRAGGAPRRWRHAAHHDRRADTRGRRSRGAGRRHRSRPGARHGPGGAGARRAHPPARRSGQAGRAAARPRERCSPPAPSP